MRDRLVKLVLECNTFTPEYAEQARLHAEYVADHLLANGVIVPPCKVGQTVYYITGIHGRIVKEATVEEIYFSESDFSFLVSTKYSSFVLQRHEVYFSREEADKALKEAEG